MKTFLVDTNILIDFFKRKPETQRLITQLTQEGRPAISVLTLSELIAGWTDEQASNLLPYLYKLVAVQPITQDIAEHAGRLQREYKSKGIQLSLADTLIATTAILRNWALVTRDTRGFPMPELTKYPLPEAALPAS